MTSPSESAEGSRLRRALARIAAGTGLGVVFVASLAGGVVLHMDLPAARRQIERSLRQALEGTFEGAVDARGFDHVGLDGIAVQEIVVHDPAGNEVLHANGVLARASVPTIARSLLGSDDLRITLPFVRIDRLEALVEPNDRGEMSVAAAFNPRAKGEPSGPGRPLHFALAHAEIGAVHAHGKPDGSHEIDADLTQVAGSLSIDPGAVAIDLVPTRVVERRSLPEPITGAVDFHLRVAGPKDANDARPSKTTLWSTFAGSAGEVGVAATALLDGSHLDATAVIPRADPEEVKAIYPAYPLLDAASVRVTASGDLPMIDVQAIALTESRGAAVVVGRVTTGDSLRADATFATSALDPRAASADAPGILVTSRGIVHAEIGALVSVRVDVETDPTSLGATPIPGVNATAIFDGSVWTGSAHVHEPGAPIHATFATRKDGAIAFDATVSAPRLAGVPRIAKANLRGAATLHAAGTILGKTLDANIDGQVRGLRVKTSATVDRAAVRGRLHGPMSDLALEATVRASDVFAAGYGLDDAVVRLSGPVLRPTVRARLVDTQRNHIDVAAVLDPGASAATRVSLHVSREGVTADAQIARIASKNSGFSIEGVALRSEQLGRVDGSLGVANGEITGALHAKNVDLAALGKVLGLPRTLEGRADVDVSLARTKGGRTGSVHLTLAGGAGALTPTVLVRNVTGQIDATFEGDRVQTSGLVAVSGTGDRCSGTIAKLRVTGGDGRIEGPLLSADTWERAHGAITIGAEDWDLACLSEMAPFVLPVSEIFGMASAKLSVERKKGQRFPSIHAITANTRYLSFVGSAPGEPGSDGARTPFASRDLDVEIEGSLDGETGAAKLDFSVWDASLLADAKVSATLDLAALVDPRRRKSSLAATPIAGHVTVPRRKIETLRTLPSIVSDKIPALDGDITLDAYAVGTLAEPHAVVRARGFGVAPSSAEDDHVFTDDRAALRASAFTAPNPWSLPIDLDIAAAYDGRKATLDAHLLREKTQLATADATFAAPIEKVLAGGPALTAALRGDLTFTLDGLPLGDIPYLADHDVRGALHGTATIQGLGGVPSLDAQLVTKGLQIGRDLAFPEARISVTARGDTAGDQTAVASIRFADQQGGALDLNGYARLGWRSGFLPALREDRPADAYAHFARFRLATFEPFLGGVIRKLDGFVDGGVRAGWGRIDQAQKTVLDVDLRVADATFYEPRLGQDIRLSGAGAAPLHITADRKGEVRIDGFVARMAKGRMTGSAMGHIYGLRLFDATATLAIGEDEPLPITLEGVEQGALWGAIDLHAELPYGVSSHLDIHSKDLHFKIPSSSSRDVLSLARNPDVVVLQDRLPPADASPSAAAGLTITARLETMTIEGDGVHITLSTFEETPPKITLTDKIHAEGDIRLLRGTVDVVGRKFELDQGTVHLPDNPSNPFLDVTAHWNAPDGSTIFVDYTGALYPITQDKLRFRSDPARTQQQALAMLLFGSETGGAVTTASSNDTGAANGNFGDTVGKTAANLGGELAAAQFNALLKGIAPLKGLSTSLGTNDTGGVKTSLVYQVGDTLSAKATYEAGAPAGSTTSTTTTSTSGASTAPGASVSIDWRFYKNWLIRASVGTSADVPKGEVDLLWQYRY